MFTFLAIGGARTVTTFSQLLSPHNRTSSFEGVNAGKKGFKEAGVNNSLKWKLAIYSNLYILNLVTFASVSEIDIVTGLKENNTRFHIELKVNEFDNIQQ